MTEMHALAQHTRQALTRHPDTALLVGYSGGGDSSSLLHVLAALPEARARGLRAIHVNHGLAAQAAQWVEHCRECCARIQVPLVVVTVKVDEHAGDGPEAAARKARYRAFADTLQDNEALLLAHHRDDQAETILLKLLRGAGPEGLGGMREWRQFARGWLWRPWLQCARQSLVEYQQQQPLHVVQDPANSNVDLARSWLRQDIMPRLQRHWPQAVASITHSGTLSAAASDFISQQVEARSDMIGKDDGSLDASAWLALHDALRGPMLDRWLHDRGLAAPSTAQRREIERQATEADSDCLPHIHWPGTDVRLWRGRLHANAPLPVVPDHWQQHWHGEAIELPLGRLCLTPQHALRRFSPSFPRGNDEPGQAPPRQAPDLQNLPQALSVRLRRGGEYLHPAGDPHGRELRYIFQQSGLPPWLRPYCPLLFHHEELLAVADLCMTAAGEKFFAPLGVLPHWRYHV